MYLEKMIRDHAKGYTSEAAGRRALRSAVLTGLFVLVLFAVPLWATDHSVYYYPDGSWNDGADKGQGNAGFSNSSADYSQGTLKVLATTAGYGSAWAKAWVSKSFVYSHHSFANEIKMQYSVKGLMQCATAKNVFEVEMVLDDVTTGSQLRRKKGIDIKDGETQLNDTQRFITFSHLLEQGHEYKVTIQTYGWVQSKSGAGAATVDFMDDLQGYRIEVDHFRVSHSHKWVETWCGDPYSSYTASGQLSPVQEMYNEARYLKVKAGPPEDYDDGIKGAYFLIRDFDEAKSYLDSKQEYAYAEAEIYSGNPGIPQDTSGFFRATLYLDSSAGCGNDCELKAWWKSSGDEDPIAVPEHSWAVLYPLPVPGSPGTFKHTFIMKNPVASLPLRIGSLTFLATMDEFDDFREIEFPDEDLYEFTLNSAQPTFSIDITTDGPLYDGNVYFAYELFDPMDQSKVICSAWGGHKIAAPLEADSWEVSSNLGGQVHFDLDATKDHASRSYFLFGSVSGTEPGTPLPGGKVVLPINWDIFTGFVVKLLNTPLFNNFMGILDSEGTAKATFDTLAPIPGAAGLTMYFAYALSAPPAWDFVSNPVGIQIVP